MKVAGITRDSCVDGVGVRDVIFLQGCSHHCKGCHNPQTWNYNGGTVMSVEDITNVLQDSDNHVTISGGEPLDQLFEVLPLTEALKQQGKRCWLYTGYKFDDIPMEYWWELCLNGVEVVVDGEYHEDERDLSLMFRGSSNQRVIDLRKTLDNVSVVEVEGMRL